MEKQFELPAENPVGMPKLSTLTTPELPEFHMMQIILLVESLKTMSW
jgi:hypothetical protein